jgi:integrase
VRQAKGPRLFTPEQLRAILSHATVNMRAMILLGINAGLGNTDLVLLPINAVDLDGGWLDYPRHKTAVPRRAPLWPETVQAIRDVLARRPTPKPEDSAFLFLRAIEGVVCRMEWFHIRYDYAHAAKLAGVEGRGFYDLRRTFQTIAERAWDLVAVQAIMGHTPASRDMSAVYRQKVDDERLQAVADHVRRWLFGDVAGDARQSGEPPILRLIGWV